MKKGSLYPTPFTSHDYGDGFAPKTRLELLFQSLSNSIRSKPQWQIKMKDAEIVPRWKAEFVVGGGGGAEGGGLQGGGGGGGGGGEGGEEGEEEGEEEDDDDEEEEDEEGAVIASAEKEKVFALCLEQLQYIAETFSEPKCSLSAVNGVFQSDSLLLSKSEGVEGTLREALLREVAKLEGVPEEEKDWHPGSNQQVLDLVHPSLFPLVYGVSSALDAPTTSLEASFNAMGRGTPLQLPEDVTESKASYAGYSVSDRFQWLPSEFAVASDGGEVKVSIESYINNLHPEDHRVLYTIIEQTFAKCLPLLSAVLESLKATQEQKDLDGRTHWEIKTPSDDCNWYDEDEPPSDDLYDDDEAYEAWENNRKINIPELPEQFTPLGEKPGMDPLKVLEEAASTAEGGGAAGAAEGGGKKKLQVITKLANIELTPESPRYPGGSWHVEGMEGEHIVATAIYYYSSDNIGESRLLFRQAIREPEYQQNDNRGVHVVFGLEDGEGLSQPLGGVTAEEGRCIAFPNIYQHRVAPFELLDKTKPGHRKILVFFLVDPALKVVSTASVPPQQRSWIVRATSDALTSAMSALSTNPTPDTTPAAAAAAATATAAAAAAAAAATDAPPPPPPSGPLEGRNPLPDLALDTTLGFVGGMTLEQAKAYRAELMDERRAFVEENNEVVFEREFSLCEH